MNQKLCLRSLLAPPITDYGIWLTINTGAKVFNLAVCPSYRLNLNHFGIWEFLHSCTLAGCLAVVLTDVVQATARIAPDDQSVKAWHNVILQSRLKQLITLNSEDTKVEDSFIFPDSYPLMPQLDTVKLTSYIEWKFEKWIRFEINETEFSAMAKVK